MRNMFKVKNKNTRKIQKRTSSGNGGIKGYY